MVQLLHEEKEKAQALAEGRHDTGPTSRTKSIYKLSRLQVNSEPGSGTPKMMSRSADLLANPLIFIRKWIGEV